MTPPTQLRARAKSTIAGLALSTAAQFILAQSPAPNAIVLSPGSEIQSAVTAAGPGATFVLTAGTYRMQSIAPQTGDTFVGQGVVILNGAILLSFSSQPGVTGLWVANATAEGSAAYPCSSDHPLCDYPQDLFIDGQIQTPVASLNSLAPGMWYFDRTRNQVYVASDPSGHTVELSFAPYAFFGTASGVHISNLIIEKYATLAQHGAIGDVKEGTNWVVSDVEVRWNHGAGVELGPGSTLSNSFIHHNGQLGVGMGGTGCQLIGTEISWNNYAGYEASWEAGGSKFWATTNLLVDSNYVHDNQGPGLWTDTNNIGTIYQNNTVLNNLNEGIKHEVSYQATIKNNTVKGNGNTATTWLWNAQIEVQNSSNVEVSGNTVEVPAGGGNGIAILNQNRGSGSMGPWVSANNQVHDNTITYLGATGYTGLADDTGGNTAVGNSFQNDHYVLQAGDASALRWAWFGGMDWANFKAQGEESSGTCCH